MVSDRDALVSAQYEGYPYPERDPAEERKRLIEGSPSDLAEIRHYLFAGAHPNTPGELFRALIAGGGTGDGTIMLAQQCVNAGLPAEITYLDLSSAARRIAEARAKMRGLSNLRFESGSLLQVRQIAPGPYDYIDCCGVLHHLEDPAAGLAELVGVLKPGGGIGLMVYGTLGRRGVYETQELLRVLAPAQLPDSERISRTRRLVEKLPATNWLRRNPFVQDHRGGGDAGIYDLLLHARDQAYRVRELADLLAAAGLEVASFIPLAAYQPDTYLNEPGLLAPLQGLPLLDQAAAAEALAGNMRHHVLYAVRIGSAEQAVADPADTQLKPILHRQQAKTLAEALRRGKLQVSIAGFDAAFPVPARTAAVAARIDGFHSLAKIEEQLCVGDPHLSAENARAIVGDAFNFLNRLNLALLRT